MSRSKSQFGETTAPSGATANPLCRFGGLPVAGALRLALVCAVVALSPVPASGFSSGAGIRAANSDVRRLHDCGVASNRPTASGARGLSGSILLGISSTRVIKPVTILQDGVKKFSFGADLPTSLLVSSFAFYTSVLISAPTTLASIFPAGSSFMSPFQQNFLPAFMCFAAADVVAQACEALKNGGLKKSLKLSSIAESGRRILIAGMVGILCNAIGLTVWLQHLNSLIPAAVTNIDSALGVSNLVTKAMFHNMGWGFLSNSISLFLRRVGDGHSLGNGAFFWHRKIVQVTKNSFSFWPAVMFANFAFVSPMYQVRVTALAAFMWNSYMSIVSNGVMAAAKVIEVPDLVTADAAMAEPLAAIVEPLAEKFAGEWVVGKADLAA